jgi:hypothetical protein
MVGDEVITVEIVVESMVMMKAKIPLSVVKRDQSGPDILVFYGDGSRKASCLQG